MMTRTPRLLPALLAVAALLTGAAIASARMQSERLDRRLCETVGGGRFVPIPGFPGEKIDRRLLRDVKMLVRRYKIFITDGYSTDPVHSANGEHPIGLALDIVPDRSRGGRWRDIGRLARWAEPRQDHPRAPFRWVGYNGDAGHGRGNHLHLSWAHSPTKFGKPARKVYSVRCPRSGDAGSQPPPDDSSKGQSPSDEKGTNGGISPGKAGRNESSDRITGGISFRKAKKRIRRQQRRAAHSHERGGIGVDR